MKIAFAILLLSFCDYLQAQDSLHYYSFVVTPQGDIINRNNYGKKEGRWLHRDSIGRRVESYYVDGKKQGNETKFTRSGVPLEISTYKDGQLDGKVVEYWNGTDKVYSISEYKNGKQNGKAVTYYKNGNMSRTSNYINGLENGKFISYYKNGTKSVIGEMQNGKGSGIWKVYFPIFGKIREFRFDSKGNKVEQINYVWGVKISEKHFDLVK